MSVFPLVSVLVPNFNSGYFLERCLRSILSQETAYPFETIFVDDASTDDSWRLAQKFKSEIKLLRHGENLGLPSALNTAIDHARGRYVVRVDSDDYIGSQYIELLTLTLESNPLVDAVSCDYTTFESALSGHQTLNWHSSEEEPIGCGIMFRTEHVREIGKFDSEMLYNEDKELIQRFSRSGRKVTRLPIPLYRYRIHESSLSRNEGLVSEFDRRLAQK